ncbi:MAG: cyclodeaminase/cyclohydrolase family protein [Deltaproteobacteria bacterium]|nr:cyclodeaminase/cyclohydrolase family protein [Deltaproteobacteria bacterium]
MKGRKLVEKKVTEFCQELASESPAPGGGSVAALSGALAASLASMVCRLTVSKKKFTAVEEEMRVVMEGADTVRQTLLKLVEEDTQAYEAVMDAYKLPKGTSDERAARERAVQDALKKATGVPLEVAKQATAVLGFALRAAQRGNPNAVTDAGVCALVARAAVEGAILNVKVNLESIEDEGMVAETRRVSEKIRSRAAELADKVGAEVAAKIGA